MENFIFCAVHSYWYSHILRNIYSRSYILVYLVYVIFTCLLISFCCFINILGYKCSGYQVAFYLWQIGPAPKHCKVLNIMTRTEFNLQRMWEDSFIIPSSLLDQDKPSICADIPFCEKNENKSTNFIKKFHPFTNGKYRISINWITKKVKGLFPLKDKNIYPVGKIYDGLCSCKENYIGESKRNMATIQGENNNSTHDPEPAKHLNKNI